MQLILSESSGERAVSAHAGFCISPCSLTTAAQMAGNLGGLGLQGADECELEFTELGQDKC